jgi:hypothetical protein
LKVAKTPNSARIAATPPPVKRAILGSIFMGIHALRLEQFMQDSYRVRVLRLPHGRVFHTILSLVSEMDEFVEGKAEFGKLVHVRQHGGKATPEGVFGGTVHCVFLVARVL